MTNSVNLSQSTKLVPFKAEPYQINYNTRRTPVRPELNQDDMFIYQTQEQQKQQKKAKSKEKWEKAGTIAQIGLAVAFGFMAMNGFVANKINKKAYEMQKEAIQKGAKEQLDNLTGVLINWVDCAKEKTVAALDTLTTASSLKNAAHDIINGSSKTLTDAGKKWGGHSDDLDIMYLYGHGGTGKTYYAEQFAQEIGAMFASIKYSDLGSPYKDAASMKISSFFDEIVAKATELKDRKLVVCIDEIDALIKVVQDTAGGGNEAGKSRAALLTGLDKIRKNCKNVTVIMTSNYHPKNKNIDSIVLRRVNNKIEVPLPDKVQTKALLEMYMKKIGAFNDTKFIDTPEAQNFIEELVEGGYSNGEISLIAKEAGKIFRASLKGVADEDLKNHPFKIEYLNRAKEVFGQAASLTNELMDFA